MKQLDDDFFNEVMDIYKERRSSKIENSELRTFNEQMAGDALYVFCLAMNKLIKKDYFSNNE